VLKALTAFDDRPVLVLLGGRNKGNDFGVLARAVAERCRLAVLFGEAVPQLAVAFASTGVETREAATMAAAVKVARSEAHSGDVVLLSPACASFDEFRSYEHRGATFKRIVAEMAASGGGETA
jgi:UDP-N-acetylmuramoylalanine--D-glutamate ligase